MGAKMITYGIMQGRLTPERGRGIQFFPFENWHEEFERASMIGLDEIEWIFDYERYQENPLWTSEGCKQIIQTIQNTKVKVKSICFDYFMRRPFYKYEGLEKEDTYKENIDIITIVLKHMSQIGASIIEIPVVDYSSIKNPSEQAELTRFLQQVYIVAESYNIKVGLETDFKPGIFAEYLDSFNGKVYANYDSGNSSGLGYNAKEELLSLKNYVINVHIKDRAFQGTTKPLGTGSADFAQVFESLKKIGYKSSFILQAARGMEDDEINTIEEQLQFVKNYVEKYDIK